MPEQQDIASFFRFEELQSLLPLEKNVRFMTLWNMIPLEKKNKYHLEVLQSWVNTLVYFENMARKEDSRSIEEEKQLFFKKICIDEDTLKTFITYGIDFFLRFYRSSTDEEFESIKEERNAFFKDKIIIFETALRNSNFEYLERNRNYENLERNTLRDIPLFIC